MSTPLRVPLSPSRSRKSPNSPSLSRGSGASEVTQLFGGAHQLTVRGSPRESPLSRVATAVVVDPGVAATAARRRPSLREAGAGLAERIVNTIADIVTLVRMCVRAQ